MAYFGSGMGTGSAVRFIPVVVVVVAAAVVVVLFLLTLLRTLLLLDDATGWDSLAGVIFIVATQRFDGSLVLLGGSMKLFFI
jgi:hypothetical protein